MGRGRHHPVRTAPEVRALAGVGGRWRRPGGDAARSGQGRGQPSLAVVPPWWAGRAVHHPARVRPPRPRRHRRPVAGDRHAEAHHRGWDVHACYLPGGYVVYACNGTLLAIRFDLETLATIGQPAPVENGVYMRPMGGNGYAAFDVSPSGSLISAAGIGCAADRVAGVAGPSGTRRTRDGRPPRLP